MATRWTQADVDNYRALMPRALIATGQLKAKKPAKYRNVKTTDAKGNVHDSGKEYRRWCDLQLREKAGDISELRRQVPYRLCFNGVHICDYRLDFRYNYRGETIYEDVKPSDPKFRKTQAYRMFRVKQNLMLACYNIQIREV